MSIKPVDFQVMLPRTGEVSKIRTDEQNKNHALQQQSTSLVQHEADDSLRLVHSQEGVQQAKIKDKQEKEKNREGKKKNKGNYNNKKETDQDIKYSTIDIKI